MKKSMKRMIALVLALMLALSASALADERASDPFRVPGVKERPGQTEAPAEGAEATSEPEVATPEDDSWTLGDIPIDPNPQPTEEPAAQESVAPEVSAEPEATAEPVPEETEVPKQTVKITNGHLNVRAEPSMEAEIIAHLYKGDVVEVLSPDGEWTKIRTEGGVVGYAATRYLSSGEPEEAAPERKPAESEQSEQSATQAPAQAYEYERNSDGSLKLDESGNPIPVLPEDAQEKPAGFRRDENGNLVLDENGNPIPTQFIPVDAQKVHTIEDALDPNRSIDIYADWGGGQLYFGMESQLIAVLNGYDNLVYNIQWQTSPDDATWSNVPGATGTRISTTVTEENYKDYWRVEVTITDVIEPVAA